MNDPLKILIVDDDEVDRMTVHRALRSRRSALDVTEATSCLEAMAALQAHPRFDCLFLDYRLPDGNGLEFIQQLRSAGVRVPVIVLTGQGDEEVAVELMKAGASDYLTKSKISGDTLPRLLQNAVRLHRSEMETERAYQMLRHTNELLTRQNQKLLEQQQKIQLQNLQLLEASRLKSEFLATMSHELRTPLNAIIGFSQILLRRKQNLDAKQSDMVQRILGNGKHLLELISDILDLSRIEAGRLELVIETVDLKHLIENTVYDLQSLAEQKQLPIILDLQLQNMQLTNDSHRLRQVLVNLLSNAIKFTDEGGIRIVVSEPTPTEVAIAIQDTGVGIAAEQLPSIFEPFRQVDQSISRRYSGSGLGLAITASLVQMMGGQITVKSELKRGTEFCVTLPRSASDVSSENGTDHIKYLVEINHSFQINQSSIQSSLQENK